MPAHAFLSREWIEAARSIRDEYVDRVGPVELELVVNVTVTQPPFQTEPVEGHIDTTKGPPVVESGHVPAADLAVEIAYELAHSLFVERDYQLALQALFAGRVKVTGDSSKLLQIQPPADGDVSPLTAEIIARIDAITLPHDRD